MKNLRTILFTVFAVMFFSAIFLAQMPENDIMKAFVTTNSLKSKSYISKIATLANKRVNIIFETENEETQEELKNLFFENFDKANPNNQNFSEITEITEVYKTYPNNFLTEQTRDLIKNKDYKTLNKNALERLYNPLGVYILPPDKDPYLFATEFALKNINSMPESEKQYEGKFYSHLRYEITDKNDVKNLVKVADICNVSGLGQVYLTGVPVHSYFSAQRSSLEVNIICIISTIAFLSICLYFFRTPKVLLPIVLSIVFGILCGLCSSILFFKKIHILTFVFSTSLIGISLDYSLHYLISSNENGFRKSLLMSLCSTVLAFILLYLSNIAVLKQIAVFTVFGLLGVYLFVILVLPLSELPDFKPDFRELPVKKFEKHILAVVLAAVCFGVVNIKFCDDLKSLYLPKGRLLLSETLYNKVFELPKLGFILTKGTSFENALELEEKTAKTLAAQGIRYVALSDFISSTKKQKENQQLVKELYKNDLMKYADFLEASTKQKLLAEQNSSLYDPAEFPLKDHFTTDENTLFMPIENPPSDLKTIDIQKEMSEVIKSFRKNCLKIIPLIFAGIYLILAIFIDRKKAFKLLLPSVLGGMFPIGILSALNIPLNVFHLLAFILVIGFSLDYSIFRFNNTQNANLAVFISALSSTISFALLGFAGFKVISSLGTVLSVGIFTSYLLSLILIHSENEN